MAAQEKKFSKKYLTSITRKTIPIRFSTLKRNKSSKLNLEKSFQNYT